MRTALITTQRKQQVVLHPESTEEHRILQLMLHGGNEVTVQESPFGLDRYGNLTEVQPSQFHDPHKKHPMPVMVQVQEAAPVKRDPNVLVVGYSTLKEMLRRMHNLRQGLDERADDANTHSRAAADYEELMVLLGPLSEPNPYL